MKKVKNLVFTAALMGLYSSGIRSVINENIEYDKIIEGIVRIHGLDRIDASNKFDNWIKTKFFNSRIGYKRIMAGDDSFLNY